MSSVEEILQITDHRPWPIPSSNWSFYQEWNDVVFLHWKVSAEELRMHVPDQIELDLFEGETWVSIVAFTMENLRPRQFPAADFVSTFPELNIRTYVRFNGKPGVCFLSIEAGSRVSAMLADLISGLPYRYSDMNRAQSSFSSLNSEASSKFHVDYSIGDKLEIRGELDTWLTERYALHQDDGPFINSFEIHHKEWPLCSLNVQNLAVHYPRFENLFSGAPDLAHYSAGVKVVAWPRSSTGSYQIRT